MNVPAYIPGQSTTGNTDQRRPLYPYFSRFSLIESVLNSNYQPLLVSVDKRFSSNFSLQVAYTFSKALTDQDTVLTNTGGETDPFNRHLDYGPTNFDVTHALVTSWVWNVPSGKFQKGIAGVFLGNWQLNGYWSIYSGMPVQITSSVDRALPRPTQPS